MIWIVKGYYPSTYGEDTERNIKAFDNEAAAQEFCAAATKSAEQFYSTDNLPADWKYELEDWLDEKLQALSTAADTEKLRICTAENIPVRFDDRTTDDEMREEKATERAWISVGEESNPYDPLMWAHAGLEKPDYFVEEVLSA